MAQVLVKQSIQDDFMTTFAGSRQLHERARTVIPGGISHDGRHLRPFPIAITSALGARKWDVDGHELIDFAIGHGSLLLGHNHPDIVAAVNDQLQRGTHFGAGHEGEVAWAEHIRQLIPSAEQVKFTSSGTESTLLALRLARAATDRTAVIKFEGHFHGWNDYLLKSEKPPFADGRVAGIPEAVLDTVEVFPTNLDLVEQRLSQGDVAAVILEPSGGSWAKVPLPSDDFLERLRSMTKAVGTLLIFDEVITGFRWSPGGAQKKYGVTPDLTTLAKIVAGGLPGGAVCGRLEIMRLLAYKDDPEWNATRKVRHPGTYNANPLSAAAGVACLKLASDPAVQAHCDEVAERIRIGLNKVITRHGVPAFVWGDASVFHIGMGHVPDNATNGDLRRPLGLSQETLKANGNARLLGLLARGMLLEGVDLFNNGGLTSLAHTHDDADQTIAAIDRVLARLVDEDAFDSRQP